MVKEFLDDSLGFLHQFIRWGNHFFADDWRLVAFQPVLLICSFLAVMFVGINPGTEIGFYLIAPWAAKTWATAGLISPPLVLLSWWMIMRSSGKARYFGLWLRFGGDLGQFTTLSSFFLVRCYGVRDSIVSDERIYSLGLTAAAMSFVLLLLVRDVWKLILTEYIATQIVGRIGQGEAVVDMTVDMAVKE